MDAAPHPDVIRRPRGAPPAPARRLTKGRRAALRPATAAVVRPAKLAAVGVVLAALLRLPAFRWAVISDDEAIYDAMAQVVRRGGCMYRDVLDHKPPGLVYLYAWVQQLAQALHAPLRPIDAVHVLGLLAAVATAYGLYGVSRRALRPQVQGWPPLLFALSSTAKCAYDGLAVNGELLMAVPSIFALWALLAARRRRGPSAIALDWTAGALVGLAGLIKWQAMVLGLTFPLFEAFDPSFVGTRPWRDRLRQVLARGPLWAAGAGSVLAAAAAYFWAWGVGEAAWAWGVTYNLQYVAEGPDGLWALRRLAVTLGVVVAPAAFFYGAGAVGALSSRRGARPEAAVGLQAWTLGCALAVCVGGRFFGHYFLQLELPLCLMGAPVAARWWQARPRLASAALAAPVLFFTAFASFPAEVRGRLNGQDPDWQGLGAELAAASAVDDTLFVWGNAPLVYHYAGRTMGTRFAFCNYLTGLSPATRSEYQAHVRPENRDDPAWNHLFDDLERRRPAWLLDTSTAGWKGYGKFPLGAYPQLAGYVRAHYRAERQLGGATLYRRSAD